MGADLPRGKFEYDRIVESFEGGVLGEREHIVASGAQCSRDRTGGEVSGPQGKAHAEGSPLRPRPVPVRVRQVRVVTGPRRTVRIANRLYRVILPL